MSDKVVKISKGGDPKTWNILHAYTSIYSFRGIQKIPQSDYRVKRKNPVSLFFYSTETLLNGKKSLIHLIKSTDQRISMGRGRLSLQEFWQYLEILLVSATEGVATSI